jgi:acyl carrier protein
MEYLHLEKVGINDNFFDLGGHSLLLTQVHSRLSEMYDRDLTIVDMFRYPTIYSLAGYIGDNRKHEQQTIDIFQKSQERGSKQRQAFNSRRFMMK